MNYVIGGIGLVALLSAAAAAFLFFQLRAADARIGAVESQLKTAVAANEAKTNATKSRATTDRGVRQLPDPELLRRLQ